MSAILITGGCGFIGANLAIALHLSGRSVVAFDNLSRPGSDILCTLLKDHGIVFQHGDVRNPEDLYRLRQDISAVIDASAEPSVLTGSDPRDSQFVVHNNLFGTVNCIDFSLSHKIPILFLSTSRVVPINFLNNLLYHETDNRFTPETGQFGLTNGAVGLDVPMDGIRSLYGATKLSCELLLREYATRYDIPAIINRCGVIAGPWQLGKQDQGVLTHWLACHRYKKPLKYIGFGGTGKQVRDILHIDDLVALIMMQLPIINEFRGDVFPVGGGSNFSVSLKEATYFCTEITGNAIDIGCEETTSPADVKWFSTDISKTADTFGWRPQKDVFTVLKDIDRWLIQNESLFFSLFNKGKP